MKYIFLNDDLNGMIFLQPIFYFKYLVILNISVVVLYFKYLVILNISIVLYFKYTVILNISAVLYFKYLVILNISPVLYFKYPVILNISAVLYFKYPVIINISAVLYFKYPVILNISAASEDNATSACDLKFMKNYELSIKYCIYHSLLFYANHTYVFFILFHIEYRYDLGNV